MSALLRVNDLTVSYPRAAAPALGGVSLEVDAGEIVGVVGESGSGKSTLALAVLGLLPAGARVGGTITVGGEDLTQLTPPERRRRLGRTVAYVPQEPQSALNPTLRIGRQIDLPLARRFPDRDFKARRATAARALERMGIADPERLLASYPFQLSGGQLQRCLLALALALEPRLILADEPTTALDVTVQAEVLDLLELLAAETGAGVLFISHNIAVVWRLCARLVVLASGAVVETGPARQVIAHPAMPYTQSLIAALPSLSAPRTPLPMPGGGPA